MNGPVGPDLYIDPVVGWRVWRLERNDNGAWLRSYIYGIRWPHRKTMRAHCLHAWARRRAPIYGHAAPLTMPGTVPPHDAPYMAHTCGVYACDTRQRAREHLGVRNDQCVLGQVKLWGRIVVTDRGWRAEYAYPDRLWLVSDEPDPDTCHELEESYGVCVETRPRSGPW